MPKNLTPDTYAWYRRYPGRALAGMKGLNPEQRGVYGTIIDLCYDRRSPLTDDDVSMARECECDVRRYRRIKAELLALKRIVVDEENGIIYDERAVRELVAAQMFSESQAERARKPRKQSTRKSQKAGNRATPEVPQNLQDLDRTVGPKSPPPALKDNDKTLANRTLRESSSSTEPPTEPNEQARPPSPSTGGGRATGERAKQKAEMAEAKRLLAESGIGKIMRGDGDDGEARP